MAGLNQDDFRRILATPRREPAGATPSMPGPGGAPVSLGKKKEYKYRPPRKDNKEKGEDAVDKPAPYRDRARERREGAEDEMEEETRRILKKLTNSDDADTRDLDESESKYLGGDLAHTHLVRGLDHALLDAQRKAAAAAAAAAGAAAAAPASSSPTSHASPSPSAQPTAMGPPMGPPAATAKPTSEPTVLLAQRILAAALPSAAAAAPAPPLRTTAGVFAPGRMVYLFDVEAAGSTAPSTLVRSQADLQAIRSRTVDSLNDLVVRRVCTLFAGLRAAAEREPLRASKREATVAKPVAAPSPAAPAAPAATHVDDADDDDDIFPNAGAYKAPVVDDADAEEDVAPAKSWFTAPDPAEPATVAAGAAKRTPGEAAEARLKKQRPDYDMEALGKEVDADDETQFNSVAFDEVADDDLEVDFARPSSLKRFGLKEDEEKRGDSAAHERKKIDKDMTQIDKIFKTKYNKAGLASDSAKPAKPAEPRPSVAATPKRRRLDVE